MNNWEDKEYESALITDQAFESIGNHNATCPFCGEQALVASIDERYWNVPLFEDGYITQDGEQAESDITEIVCGSCGRVVPVEHYWHTRVCDCVKEE